MAIDVEAAGRFVLENGRLLDRHRLAVLLDGAPVTPVLDALRAYRNPDGGFGHALEPDVRDPASQPAATLHALVVLAEVGALDDPMVADAAAWSASVAHPDGALPFVLPSAAAHPRAPWMEPDEGASFLTFAVSGLLWEAGSEEPWLEAATAWCWSRLEGSEELGAYWVNFALDFLDRVPDEDRARAASEGLRPMIGADGTIAVPGGTEDERLTPLAMSDRPGKRSRALFGDDQIEADLDQLEQGQREDGGWMFEWLDWSPGQRVEWRGGVTLEALATLAAHGRLDLPRRG
jgi:hypothetical protein